MGTGWTIRPTEAVDFEAIAQIESQVWPEPTTPDQIGSWEALSHNPDYPSEWFTAVDSLGRVAGWGQCGRSSSMEPDLCFVYVAVFRAFRRRGLGTMMFSYAKTRVAKHNPSSIEGWLRGDDDESYAWALKQGFHLKRQRTESVLDLSGWDESRFAAAFDKVENQGISIVCVPGSEAEPYYRGMYKVFCKTFGDIPFVGEEWTPPNYATWLQELNAGPGEKIFAVALDGDEVVGVSSLYLPTIEGQGAGIGYTGVLKEYRGKGIAKAMKIRAATVGRETGAKWIRTNNDEDNPAILAINEELGFKRVPGPKIVNLPLR